jgi:hypothetical protein
MNGNDYPAYVAALKAGNFVKLARLRFLNPGGDTAFILDNDPMQKHSGAFIKSGSVTVNLQNGARRSANVEITNADGEFDFKVNHVWFGTEIAVDMGLMLQDGTECWFPQGVFRVERPSETVATNGTIAHFNLIDKWAGIDGTLNGALESSYGVASGTGEGHSIRRTGVCLDILKELGLIRLHREYMTLEVQLMPETRFNALHNSTLYCRLGGE